MQGPLHTISPLKVIRPKNFSKQTPSMVLPLLPNSEKGRNQFYQLSFLCPPVERG